MKKALSIIMLIFLSLHQQDIFAQVNFPINEKGEIEYTEVIVIDSTSSEKLYSRAKMYIAEAFNSAQNVIQNDDASNKQILIKGNIEADYSWGVAACPATVNFTMTIFCKDNRYKYSIKPGEHKFGAGCKVGGEGGGNLLNEKPACGAFNMPKSYWVDIKSKAHGEFLTFITSLKKSMQIDQGSDW